MKIREFEIINPKKDFFISSILYRTEKYHTHENFLDSVTNCIVWFNSE